MSKVLILADSPGWIVDRITNEMIRRMNGDFYFIKGFYEQMSIDRIIHDSIGVDLVHFQNVMPSEQILHLSKIQAPTLMTVRSHRYNKNNGRTAATLVNALTVVNPDLIKEFCDYNTNVNYIPDGIFDQFLKQCPRRFTVGFAGHGDLDYKGYHLIKEACERLGVIFKPATNLAPDQMLEYYNSIDLYACASVAEGHSTPVMECLAMNKPVITTDVGVPRYLNVYKVDRTISGIMEGIQRYNSHEQVADYNWENVCNQFAKLYEVLIHDNPKR